MLSDNMSSEKLRKKHLSIDYAVNRRNLGKTLKGENMHLTQQLRGNP